MHLLWLIVSVVVGVGLLFAAFCLLLVLATTRLGTTDDPEGR